MALTDALHAQTSKPVTTGRTAALGAVTGFVSVTALITAFGTVTRVGVGASLLLGAFAGMWGGVGFGFMLGGTWSFTGDGDVEAQPRK